MQPSTQQILNKVKIQLAREMDDNTTLAAKHAEEIKGLQAKKAANTARLLEITEAVTTIQTEFKQHASTIADLKNTQAVAAARIKLLKNSLAHETKQTEVLQKRLATLASEKETAEEKLKTKSDETTLGRAIDATRQQIAELQTDIQELEQKQAERTAPPAAPVPQSVAIPIAEEKKHPLAKITLFIKRHLTNWKWTLFYGLCAILLPFTAAILTNTTALKLMLTLNNFPITSGAVGWSLFGFIVGYGIFDVYSAYKLRKNHHALAELPFDKEPDTTHHPATTHALLMSRHPLMRPSNIVIPPLPPIAGAAAPIPPPPAIEMDTQRSSVQESIRAPLLPPIPTAASLHESQTSLHEGRSPAKQFMS